MSALFQNFYILLSFLLFLSPLVFATEEPVHSYGQFEYKIDPNLPEWVKPVKSPKSRGKPEGQGAEYLLVDTQVKTSHDDYAMYYSTSTVLHNSQSIADNSEVYMTFNPLYQKLVVHEISVMRKRKVVGSVSPHQIRLLQREQDLKNGILDGVVSAIAIVPNTRVGDRLDVKYTVVGRNPVYGEKIFGSHSLGWRVDVALASVRLLVPKDIQIQTREHNLSKKVKVKKRGQFKEYVWRNKKVEAVFDEGDYPAWYVPYPWVEYSEYRSWSEVKDWAVDLYSSVNQKSAKLNDLSIELSLEADGDDMELVSRALKFSQENIRYLGLEFGQNSHLPHDPEEVISNRYGDCKDKSNLLVQLLNMQGFDASSALVSYGMREGFTDILPSPAAFDHVVVVLELDGKKIWVDPTKTHQAGRVDKTGFTYFGKALVINENSDDVIVDVKPLETQADRQHIIENYVYKGPGKPTELKVKTRYQGSLAEAQRYRFASNDLDSIQKSYLSYYSKLYPKIRFSDKVEYQDDRINNNFVVTEKYLIEEFSTLDEDLHRTEHYAYSIAENLISPKQIIRSSPSSIGTPKRVRHQLVIDYENEVGLHIDSEPNIRKTDEFEYRSWSSYRNKRFVFDSDLQINSMSVSADALSSYLSSIKKVREDIDFILHFQLPYEKPEIKKKSSLLKSMGEIRFE